MADRALDSAGTQSARAMDLLKRSGKAQSADNLNRAYLAQLHEEDGSAAINDMLDVAANGGGRSPGRVATRGTVREPRTVAPESDLPVARLDEGNPSPVVTGNRVTGQADASTAPANAGTTVAPATPGTPTTATPGIPLTAEDSARAVDAQGYPVYSRPESAPATGRAQDPTYSEDATQYGAVPQQGPNLEPPQTGFDRVGSGPARYIPPAQTPVGAPVVPGDMEAGGDPMRLEAPGETPMANPTAGASVPDVSSPQTQALIQREAAKRGVDPAKIAEVLQQWQANPQMMQSQLSGMLGEVNNPGVSMTPPTSPQVLELDAGRANPTVSPLDLLGAGRAAGRGIANLVQRGVASNDPVVAPGFNPAPGSQSGPSPASMDQLRAAMRGGTNGPPAPPTAPVSATGTASGPVPVGAIPRMQQPAPMPSGPMPTPARASELPMSPHIPRPAYQPHVPPVNPNPGPPLAGPGPQFRPQGMPPRAIPPTPSSQQQRLLESLTGNRGR